MDMKIVQMDKKQFKWTTKIVQIDIKIVQMNKKKQFKCRTKIQFKWTIVQMNKKQLIYKALPGGGMLKDQDYSEFNFKK